jgi:hypothetical protein
MSESCIPERERERESSWLEEVTMRSENGLQLDGQDLSCRSSRTGIEVREIERERERESLREGGYKEGRTCLAGVVTPLSRTWLSLLPPCSGSR